jgi:hypothetical protein
MIATGAGAEENRHPATGERNEAGQVSQAVPCHHSHNTAAPGGSAQSESAGCVVGGCGHRTDDGTRKRYQHESA